MNCESGFLISQSQIYVRKIKQIIRSRDKPDTFQRLKLITLATDELSWETKMRGHESQWFHNKKMALNGPQIFLSLIYIFLNMKH